MTDIHTDKTTIDRPDWLREPVWPYQIRTAAVDGETVSYTDEGEGPTLLLVHDGMWSYVWGQLIERLRHDFRVVTLDFPGSGLSPNTGHRPGLNGDSMLLESFVEELGLTDVTLVVHDLGGPVGVGLAMRRPELVRGFAFINTFAWPPQHAGLRAMLAIMSSRPVTALNVTTNLVHKLTASTFGIGRHLDNDARTAFVGPYGQHDPRRRFHTLMGSARQETGYLAEIEEALQTTLADRPVLTIYGEKNDPFGFQARFKALFPGAEELVIAGGNHFPMADDPDLVAETITGWYKTAVA